MWSRNFFPLKSTWSFKWDSCWSIFSILCYYGFQQWSRNKLPYRSTGVHPGFLCPRDKESGGWGGYLLQFWSYSFNILQVVYRHNGGVLVHRILIFFKYSQNDRQLDLVIFSYQLHKGNMVCPANSSYSFNIQQEVYTHNGGVHVHRILIFIKYSQNDRQLDSFCSSVRIQIHGLSGYLLLVLELQL